ncbi:hypothetical protein ACHWQZ_G001334 [Mnemiopsis leidyi]
MTWNGDNLERGTCVPCKPGTYRREDMMVCTTCPSGSTSTEGQDYCLCTAGFFWDGAGLDLENSVQRSCTSCPTEATSLAGSSSCLCPAGTTWSDTKLNCEECKPGQVSQAGSLQCTECPDGSVDKVTCSCKIGHVWSWIERERGECLCLNISLCLSQSESENDIDTAYEHSYISDNFMSNPLFVILATILGIITIVFVCFIGLYIRERKRNGMKNSAKVLFRHEQQNVDSATVTVLQSQYHDLIVGPPEPRIEDSFSNDEVYNTLNETTPSRRQEGQTTATRDEMYSDLGNSKPNFSATDREKDVTEDSADNLYSLPWKRETDKLRDDTDDSVYNTLDGEAVHSTIDEEKLVQVSKNINRDDMTDNVGDYRDAEEISQCLKERCEVYSTLNHREKEKVHEEEDGEAVYTKLNR